jgi:hypothetical protein
MTNHIDLIDEDTSEYSQEHEASLLPPDIDSSESEYTESILATKAKNLGAPEDIAHHFTPAGLHALRVLKGMAESVDEAARKSVNFANEQQANALELLEYADLSVSGKIDLSLKINSDGKYKALEKTLELELSPIIALSVTNEFAKEFQKLSTNDPITKALTLDVPLEKAFEFNTQALNAWKIIKKSCTDAQSEEEGINLAILIKNDDPYTTPEAIEKGVPTKYVRSFTNQHKVSAWGIINKNPNLDLETKVASSLKIDTAIKLAALQAGVDHVSASKFNSQYQVESWSEIRRMKGKTATDALIVNTEVKLNALKAGVTLDQVKRFETQIQVDGYELIEPQLTDKALCVDLSLGITDPIHIKALEEGVPPGNAIKLKTDLQITAWKKIKDTKDINKAQAIEEVSQLKNQHQLDVFLKGASLKDALMIETQSQAEAFVIHNLPLESALKCDKEYKISLLKAKLDPNTATEANWLSAQISLIRLDSKKYFADTADKYYNSVLEQSKYLYKNPKEIPGAIFICAAYLITTSLAWAFVVTPALKKAWSMISFRGAGAGGDAGRNNELNA